MVGLGCKISIPKPKQHVAVVVRALFIAEAEEAKIFFCKEVSFNDPFLVVIWFYCRYFLEREHKRRDHGVIGGAMTSASTVLRQRYCGHQSVKTKEGNNGIVLLLLLPAAAASFQSLQFVLQPQAPESDQGFV